MKRCLTPFNSFVDQKNEIFSPPTSIYSKLIVKQEDKMISMDNCTQNTQRENLLNDVEILNQKHSNPFLKDELKNTLIEGRKNNLYKKIIFT